MKTHGFTAKDFNAGENRRAYRIWMNMRQRCTNPNNPRYKDYGARGITVCARWGSFAAFIEDMGWPPAGKTLDRKNNDKGYSKRNCRWADPFEQAQNSRRAVNVKVNGRTQCIAAWLRETGVSYGLYKARVKRGWPQQKALLTPPAARGLRALYSDAL